MEDCEERLEKLFMLKEKWTGKELQTHITDFLDGEMKFDFWLGRNTRTMKMAHPYDRNVTQLLYMKKF
jgi:hypothetical protein